MLETGEFERVGSSRTRRVDVRIISATNADLAAEVGGRPLPRGPALPPQHHRDPRCRRCASAARTSPRSRSTSCGSTRALSEARSRASTPGAVALCSAHAWPGNVRELDHAVERAVLMAQGERDPRRRPRPASPRGEARRDLEDMSLEEVEAFLIKKALGSIRRQREPGRRGPGALAQRALPAAAALRPLSAAPSRRDRLSHERRVLLLALAAGLPPWWCPVSPARRRATDNRLPGLGGLAVVGLWLGFAFAVRRHGGPPAADPLQPARRVARGGLLLPRAAARRQTTPSAR